MDHRAPEGPEEYHSAKDSLHLYIPHLLTLGHRVELGLELLLDSADLPGPLGALLLSHITTLLLHTLLLILSPALGHIILHQVGLSPGPALTQILSTAHSGPCQVAVLSSSVSSILKVNL